MLCWRQFGCEMSATVMDFLPLLWDDIDAVQQYPSGLHGLKDAMDPRHGRAFPILGD
jgi:hypothetical protein